MPLNSAHLLDPEQASRSLATGRMFALTWILSPKAAGQKGKMPTLQPSWQLFSAASVLTLSFLHHRPAQEGRAGSRWWWLRGREQAGLPATPSPALGLSLQRRSEIHSSLKMAKSCSSHYPSPPFAQETDWREFSPCCYIPRRALGVAGGHKSVQRALSLLQTSRASAGMDETYGGWKKGEQAVSILQTWSRAAWVMDSQDSVAWLHKNSYVYSCASFCT